VHAARNEDLLRCADVERRLFAGFSFDRFALTVYAFSLNEDDPTVVVSAGLSF
jgi:hypothetical protein